MIPKNKNTVNGSRRERIYLVFTKSIILILILTMFLYLTLVIADDQTLGMKLPFHLSLINTNDQTPGMKLAFQPGEKLTYKGKWGKIPAGELTLEVLPEETINGAKVYHFVMITKTNIKVDLIYKIRERQDSYVDTGMTHSIFYKKKTKSEHPRDVSINFNWEKREATYTNFGQTSPPIQILPGTFDPLAFFYAIRQQRLKENSVLHMPLTDGKKLNVMAVVNIGKRDTIEIEGKTYDTFEVTPNMAMMDKLDKRVKKSDHPQLKVWVTADEKKIPIKIRSSTGMISFNFDLVSGL